jgi:phosphoesterase RecJ-like protein
MSAMSRNPEAIAEAIRNARRIAVCSHINPDGDTLGCATAMRLALLYLGKEVTLFCDGKVPDILLFLPAADEIRRPGPNEGPFDLMLAVDVSDEQRLGACDKLMAVSAHTAQIDHHPTNPLFAEVNSVDGNAPAAAVLIYEQLKVLGVPMTKEIAECLYTGISTDTGNFSFAATNAECFQIMSDLMEHELPLAELNRILFRGRPMPQVKLLGRALCSLKYYENGYIAVMKLTRKDFEECYALSEHADTIVNYGLETFGTRMALLAREDDNGRIKFSLRAKEPDTINDVAQQFGGGGHPQAAGISMAGPLDEAVEKVLQSMIRKLKHRAQG